MKKVELLAPAGSFEKAKIAIMYGADALYCGTPKLSLRSRSEVQDSDLEKIVKYAHERGVKVYPAINIYLHHKLNIVLLVQHFLFYSFISSISINSNSQK